MFLFVLFAYKVALGGYHRKPYKILKVRNIVRFLRPMRF